MNARGANEVLEIGGTMPDSDRILLRQIILQEKEENSPQSDIGKFFEYFSAEQVLKDRGFDLDAVQIESGIVGGGDDGGVDAFYLFANGRLVREDHEIKALVSQQITIDVIIIQSKNKPSFQEKPIMSLNDFTDNCLKLTSDLSSVPNELYNSQITDAVRKFHDLYKAVLLKKPTLNISYYYASLGEDVNPKVEKRKQILVDKCKGHYSAADVTFTFIGAKPLLALYNKTPSTTITLHTANSMGSSAFGTSYICLVPLRRFYEFITENDVLRGHIFEANVRDFEGDVTVNNQITETLSVVGNEEFWWLNNGITIIASDVSGAGSYITITDPLIVNGLQTSYVVYRHFYDADIDDTRNILVRVIKETDERSIDNIIKATNSQTKIPAVWLHATEDIHRKIEIALKGEEYYYDRRKNHYKNQGIPSAQIITLPYLSQAVASIVLQLPNDARARPTTVANRNYTQLFSERFPIELYPKCAAVLRRVDQYLDKLSDRATKNNIMFYVAMYVTCAALQKEKPNRGHIASLDIGLITENLIQDCQDRVLAKYTVLGGDDRVAKGVQLITDIKAEISQRFAGNSKV